MVSGPIHYTTEQIAFEIAADFAPVRRHRDKDLLQTILGCVDVANQRPGDGEQIVLVLQIGLSPCGVFAALQSLQESAIFRHKCTCPKLRLAGPANAQSPYMAHLTPILV